MTKDEIIWLVWLFIDAFLAFMCFATSGIISILCGSAAVLITLLLIPFEVWDKIHNYLRRKL